MSLNLTDIWYEPVLVKHYHQITLTMWVLGHSYHIQPKYCNGSTMVREYLLALGPKVNGLNNNIVLTTG